MMLCMKNATFLVLIFDFKLQRISVSCLTYNGKRNVLTDLWQICDNGIPLMHCQILRHLLQTNKFIEIV